MNRPAVRICGLWGALLCGVLSGCRTKPPVVRHFLRMPAEYAGGLSSMERAKWIKASRPDLPPRRELITTGRLVLPPYASALGTRLDGMEVQYVRHARTRPEWLALRAGKSGPLVHLRCEHGQYSPATGGTDF